MTGYGTVQSQMAPQRARPQVSRQDRSAHKCLDVESASTVIEQDSSPLSSIQDHNLSTPEFAPEEARPIARGDIELTIRKTLPIPTPVDLRPFVLRGRITVPYHISIYRFGCPEWRDVTDRDLGLSDYSSERLEKLNASSFFVYLMSHGKWEYYARRLIKDVIDPEVVLEHVQLLTAPYSKVETNSSSKDDWRNVGIANPHLFEDCLATRDLSAWLQGKSGFLEWMFQPVVIKPLGLNRWPVTKQYERGIQLSPQLQAFWNDKTWRKSSAQRLPA